MINKIKCFFGIHKWKMVGGLDIPLNQVTHISHLHKCEYCGKEEIKGMGTFLT